MRAALVQVFKRYFWFIIAVIFCILWALSIDSYVHAWQDERSLTFGLWTEHYGGDHTEGLDNHLIALDWYGPTAAFFRNSYGKETLYLGYTWHTKKYGFYEDCWVQGNNCWVQGNNWWVQGSIGVGALIGYGTKHPIHYGALSPGVYPTVNIGKGHTSVGLGVMPTFWWLSFRVDF